MTLTTMDLDAVCGLVDELCGIYLDSSKDYLIEGRLAVLLTRHGCANYHDLAKKARSVAGDPVRNDVVDAITTNETLWFRDNSPFDALRFKVFPELLDSRSGSAFPKRLRVWSAACSTGQEAYSIAMAFADIVPNFSEWDLQIYGTDISPAAVARAKSGEYSELEIGRGLDQSHLQTHFIRDGRGWRVSDRLRSKCQFEVRNLLKPFNGVGQFDLIFCRNVAIYFNEHDRRNLFLRLSEQLMPGGFLFVGASESLTSLGPQFTPKQHCRAACYQPKGGLTYAR